MEKATKAQIAIVTVDTLDGAPIEDTANALYRQWGIGKKPDNEGILMLLAIKDHKDRLEVGYGLEPIMPDGFVGSVLRQMRPSLRENNYGAAILGGADVIGSTIAKSKNVVLDTSLPRREPEQQAPRATGIPWPMILFGIFILFWLMSRGGGNRYGGGGGGGGFLTGMILGNVLGGSGRGGGGFGGFGGGDSGGGGASSDW